MPLYDRYICETKDQRRLAGLKSFHETWKYICISIILNIKVTQGILVEDKDTWIQMN